MTWGKYVENEWCKIYDYVVMHEGCFTLFLFFYRIVIYIFLTRLWLMLFHAMLLLYKVHALTMRVGTSDVGSLRCACHRQNCQDTFDFGKPMCACYTWCWFATSKVSRRICEGYDNDRTPYLTSVVRCVKTTYNSCCPCLMLTDRCVHEKCDACLLSFKSSDHWV